MTDTLRKQQFFQVKTSLPVEVWTKNLATLPIVWTEHLFDPHRSNVYLLECALPDQIQDLPIEVCLLTSGNEVTIKNITRLIKSLQGAAAAQATAFVELFFHDLSYALLSTVLQEGALLQHAKNIFYVTYAIATESQKDYAGLEHIFTQTFVQECAPMIASRSSHRSLGRPKIVG